MLSEVRSGADGRAKHGTVQLDAQLVRQVFFTNVWGAVCLPSPRWNQCALWGKTQKKNLLNSSSWLRFPLPLTTLGPTFDCGAGKGARWLRKAQSKFGQKDSKHTHTEQGVVWLMLNKRSFQRVFSLKPRCSQLHQASGSWHRRNTLLWWRRAGNPADNNSHCRFI